MTKLWGEVDPDLTYAGICWMVTDNMKELLAIGDKIREERGGSATILQSLDEELSLNRLVIMGQDLDKDDHWFVCIGDYDKVHIIEHLTWKSKKNHVETMKRSKFIKLMRGIMSGEVPDRFYKTKSLHQFLLQSYNRKTMSRQVVLDYINQ